MLRRLNHAQPESFAFTPDNLAWARAQVTKYPEGRQASAIIPLLWRAQEQEGWLSRPAIEYVADMLGMAHIRALEVATFYFMFQLQPVGAVANIQICGTTSCMICGAEDLIGVCREKIADKPHQLSADGKFSWEEVECLGSCANAPMAQIGKDYYEDLTAEKLAAIIDSLAKGEVPLPGPQNGRYASEPLAGLTSLKEFDSGHTQYNASVQRAVDLGDTVKRIDGTEVPLLTPWGQAERRHRRNRYRCACAVGRCADRRNRDRPTGSPGREQGRAAGGRARGGASRGCSGCGHQAAALEAPREGGADDLKLIKGVGPKLEQLLHELGFYHFEQVAAWTADEVAWVDQNLQGFKGRVSRDDWVEQAKVLASGGNAEFPDRVKKGDNE
ncbi:hypothetical protein TQ29_06335 [Actibacterium sp. EMB200-NS6]|uniref:NADH-quinone oxidoreductase subunit E n=1 Tax=Actibacterium sp. EMB200-NS6 TaxID=1609966 RepID=UPI0006C939CD|nr:NADH-quinone oxidoreductase subunit E [Actibacterium sp. EMB200-NS6]ALG89885.1 hypothetical protein TQ29_06335 [Actibacterium sp. EMB200-NS6]